MRCSMFWPDHSATPPPSPHPLFLVVVCDLLDHSLWQPPPPDTETQQPTRTHMQKHSHTSCMPIRLFSAALEEDGMYCRHMLKLEG